MDDGGDVGAGGGGKTLRFSRKDLLVVSRPHNIGLVV